MRHLYGTFLIRCWRLGSEERFEVQHIQSGNKVVVPSLASIDEWIHTQANIAPTTPTPRPPPANDKHDEPP